MEQKLAEFRAQREADNAVKNSLNPKQTVDTQPETTSTSANQRTREKVDSTRDSAQTSPTKVRQD